MERDQINKLKQLPMADYLACRGYNPVGQRGQRLCYYSPFRSETTPSFWVDQSLNRYKDFGTLDKGDDLLQLVMRLDGCPFKTALTTLFNYAGQEDKSRFSFIGPSPANHVSSSALRSVKLLNNRRLVDYVTSRRISYPIARRYVQEVYYQHNDTNLFALGFANDKEGYALRSAAVKRNLGPAAITTIMVAGSLAVNVFEGFFNFLSALEYYQLSSPRCTTIVLNSTTNVLQALPTLLTARRVNVYLDNDQPGRVAFLTLQQAGVNCIDRAGLYASHNDFNDFWMAGQSADSPDCP